MSWAFEIAVFFFGYAVSAYSWPMIRTFLMGVETEIEAIEARLRKLRDALR